MQDKILALVPSDFALGFKLTGIDTEPCAFPEEAKAYLSRELTQSQYSIIIIDEEFLLSFEERFNKKIQESTKPLVMAIPLKKTFQVQLKPKDYFLKMVQDAIGYEIRIR